MPHITIKSYPKGLTDKQWQEFTEKLTLFVSESLNTPADYISIDYQEVAEQVWKTEVYDKEIVPRQEVLLKKPNYEL